MRFRWPLFGLKCSLRLRCRSLLRVALNTNVCNSSASASAPALSLSSPKSGSISSSLKIVITSRIERIKKDTRRLPQCEPQYIVELCEMPGLNHAVCLVEHQELEVFQLSCKFAVLHTFNIVQAENMCCILTSSRMSHSRPGVATSTSTPRSRIRLCFCVDIPPTIAATLTRGGVAGFTGSALSFPLPEFFFFPFPFLERIVISSSSVLTVVAGGLRHAFRCEETCRASSRVGASISARTGRLVLGGGCACARDKRWCRIGRP